MASGRLPSPYLLAAIVVATLLGLVSATRGLVDADAYWHLTAGRLFVESGQVPQVDPFSFTWAGQPWTTHEWLGEVLLYLTTNVLGVGVAAFLFGVAAAAGPLLVGSAVQRRDESAGPAIVAVALAVVVLLPYVTLRPQVLSWLFLGLLLATLIRLEPDEPWRALLLAPLFLVWANVHGLYVVGLGVLGLWTVATVIGRTSMAPARRTVAAAFVLCLAATMVTPAGPAGLLYPLRYIEPGDWGLAHIAEWQSPDFRDPRSIGLLLVLATLVVTVAARQAGWLRLTVVAAVVGALLAVRNAPILAVAAIPSIVAGLRSRWPASRPSSPATATSRRVLEIGLAAILVVVAAFAIPGIRTLRGETAIAASFPVGAVDTLQQRQPDANVLAEYQWGGYLIYRLHDEGGRVFVDGRNDMYDQQILDDYLRIRNAADGWEELVRDYGVEAIILPPEAAVVSAATASDWCLAYEDAVAVLILPSCAP